MKLNIKDTFNKELPSDAVKENYVRQVKNACFSDATPTPCANPSIVHFSEEMMNTVGIEKEAVNTDDFLKIFSGNKVYEGTEPYAMCYGGHQFGSWAGQLGDGRAINLFEVNYNNQQWAVQLKGAGLTPYSRTADGLAVLRSSVREYLCSEAMHHLGVPTTRALSLALSGDKVLRDVLYNGNSAYEKGAIVTRVAPCFIRFGNFQILTSKQEFEHLKKLTDYTIHHFFPHLGAPNKDTYITFLQEVADKTTEMIVHWERVGFVHGVMNTDNMSILGLTIDYGPYGWLENYDPNWTPNTTDARQKRYRFGNQAPIAFWNIYQLANALFPLVNEAKPLEDILNNLGKQYKTKHYDMMLAKIGLTGHNTDLSVLIDTLKKNLEMSEMDMTLFFRKLSDFDVHEPEAFIRNLKLFSYVDNFDIYEKLWKEWLANYAEALKKTENKKRKQEMDAVNPKYVLRNYVAQLAIDDADNGDYNLINELYTLLKKPYDEQPNMEKWFAKRPEWAEHKVGCSMLSCSS